MPSRQHRFRESYPAGVSGGGGGGGGAPSGPAGGDLAGAYPNPTVPGLLTKADDTAVVHKSAAETVTGLKTFNLPLRLNHQAVTGSTPPAATSDIYVKANGLPYILGPGGEEIQISVGDVAGAALHTNPDFENQTAGVIDNLDVFWQNNGTVASSTSNVLSGTRSALVTLSGAGNQWLIFDTFTVAPGDVITFSVYGKKLTGSPTLMCALFTRATGTPNLFDAPTDTQYGSSVTMENQYKKFTQTFVVPSGMTVARVAFQVIAAGAASAALDLSASSKAVATAADLNWVKRRVVAVATGNVNLSGGAPSTVDGVALAALDRVLVPFNTTGSQNGIYSVTTLGTGANGTWTRVPDMSAASDIAGASVSVAGGTRFGGSRWATTFAATDTVGTTTMKWYELSSPLQADWSGTAPPTPATGIALFSMMRARALPASVAADGQATPLQPALFANNVNLIAAAGAAAPHVLGVPLPTAVAAATVPSRSTANFRSRVNRITYATAAATANSAGGFRGGAQLYCLSATAFAGGFTKVWRFGPAVVSSNSRFFLGFLAATTAFGPSTDPSATVSSIGLGADQGDANFQFMHNDASGTCTKIDTGFSKTVTTDLYEFGAYSPSGAGQSVRMYMRRLSDNAYVETGTITTNLPANDLLLNYYLHISNGATAATHSVDFQQLYIETDN